MEEIALENYESLVANLDNITLALQVVEKFLETKPELETDLEMHCFEVMRLEKSAILSLAIDKLMTLQEEHLKNIGKSAEKELNHE